MSPGIFATRHTSAGSADDISWRPEIKGSGAPAHDLRRTAITRAPESGLTYRQVQTVSKHGDPQTVLRYDCGRENLGQNAVNFLGYEEE
jgi:hypothetical protein